MVFWTVGMCNCLVASLELKYPALALCLNDEHVQLATYFVDSFLAKKFAATQEYINKVEALMVAEGGQEEAPAAKNQKTSEAAKKDKSEGSSSSSSSDSDDE